MRIPRQAWATIKKDGKGWCISPIPLLLSFCSALGIFVVPTAPPNLSTLDYNLLIQQNPLKSWLCIHCHFEYFTYNPLGGAQVGRQYQIISIFKKNSAICLVKWLFWSWSWEPDWLRSIPQKIRFSESDHYLIGGSESLKSQSWQELHLET